ncbi:MAG: sigma-54-dependent Fis family transcriptional regulator [Gammaproteobacteria bacterium]|nr:sigma-54-dependent Fis family transcriptional regulator [Gammaproteobacteria bacterium]
MSSLSVLIIDNNRSRLQSLSLLLDFMDFTTKAISQLDNLESETKAEYDLILYGDKYVTHFLPELLNLTKKFPQIPFLLLKNTENVPLDAIKQQYPLCLGVLDEPFKQDKLLSFVSSLFETDNNQSPVTELVTKQEAVLDEHQTDIDNLKTGFDSYLENNFVGYSDAILSVKKLIQQVSRSNANVLILGESGTGKEVVANCIHALSRRNEHAYVPVNCGAIPGDLLESELFGHEKGAFTGAISSRQGRFELAQRGTLFLDEIGDMPLSMQVKLLRVLQEKVFERVGGIKSIQADVRVLAATHRNLEEHVDEGKFREDLFYRLNVFPIEIPALRERVIDIPLLVNVFNRQVYEETGEMVKFSDDAMASLFIHQWPGNVRELGNLVERLSIMFFDEEVQYDDLPDKYRYDLDGFDYDLLSLARKRELDSIRSEEQSIKAENSKEKNTIENSPEKLATINGENKSSKDQDELINERQAHAPNFSSQQDVINVNSLPENDEFDLKEHLSHLEQNLIQDALNKSQGVVAHAAKRLNIRRTTLVEKMKKYSMND